MEAAVEFNSTLISSHQLNSIYSSHKKDKPQRINSFVPLQHFGKVYSHTVRIRISQNSLRHHSRRTDLKLKGDGKKNTDLYLSVYSKFSLLSQRCQKYKQTNYFIHLLQQLNIQSPKSQQIPYSYHANSPISTT